MRPEVDGYLYSGTTMPCEIAALPSSRVDPDERSNQAPHLG
ncbi:MAG: hypothetical protein ACM3VW_04675 [Bacteroidota bacterium]